MMKKIIFGQLNNEFFLKHQKILLFIANCWFLKWIIGTNRLPKALKGKKIDRILPASVSFKTGNSKIKTIYRKGFRPKKISVEEWTMNAFTRPRFAESLSYKLYPFWKLCHYWDMLFANNLKPAWNLGFDSASYFSGAGDGRTIHDLEYTGGGWSTAHDASDCGTGSLSSVVYNATEEAGYATVGCYEYEDYKRVIIARAFFPFDTSALPDGATISAATFNVYVNYVEDDDNDGDDWINIVQTSQASNTELVTGDYDQCGAVDNPTEGATRIDLGNITASQYNVWTLNATGRGWISKTGWTKLGLREGHDAIDSPISGSNYSNRIKTRFSEYTGTDSDPYLSVTYSSATNQSVSDNGNGVDTILGVNKTFIIAENGVGSDLIKTNKTFIITDLGNGIDDVNKGMSLTITDYGFGVDSVDRVIATDIDIQEWGVGVDEIETSISAEEREHRKNYHITVYRADGSFIKVWKDANFIGFRKYINGGLGDCTLSLARKFDNYGEYDDVKLNNEIRISITDEDTITSDDSEKLIYTGYISKYEPFIDGGKEGVVVTCLGYYTKFAQDIYKNGTTTTITESATDVGTMFKNLMDRFRAETSTPKLFYTGGSIETTGTTASYTFEMMTYREAIDIIKRLAPTNWWWYVDQNHLVKFKSKPSSVTHTFVFGRHFKSVHIEKGMEKIKNAVLFWNQVTGVGQVYRLYKDTVSISDFGRRVSKYFDPNRVGGTIDATKIADGLIDEHKDPDIKVKVEIIDNNYSTKGYDIESIEPGDTCSFVGFSDSLNETFKEGMIITEVEYHLDRVVLTIEPLQASIVDRIEEVARGLSSINSKDAPSAYNE